jgi:16S rRNA C1402 (ribose-2'-O) methylase RsmI
MGAESLSEAVRRLIAEGWEAKQAMKQIAKLRNVAKREVYNEYVKATKNL